MVFNPLEYPACLEFPVWLEETAWAEHIPFAMLAIAAFRPRLFVELGTFRGASYCAFCQAVKSEKTKTKCFAVDTWQGDAHAGLLEEKVLERLKSHHDPLYGNFSSLVQSTFDDALKHFAETSIDLLHIDGLHTYEAVKNDFQAWLPKMSERGIVIFHDTNVRERNFGVWKIWAELIAEHPHFEFTHGHGLGVLAVGKQISPELQFLFAADSTETTLIRNFFHQMGLRIETERMNRVQRDRIKSLEPNDQIVRNSAAIRFYMRLRKKNRGGPAKQKT